MNITLTPVTHLKALTAYMNNGDLRYHTCDVIALIVEHMEQDHYAYDYLIDFKTDGGSSWLLAASQLDEDGVGVIPEDAVCRIYPKNIAAPDFITLLNSIRKDLEK